MFSPGLSHRRLAYLIAVAACVAVFHGTPARAHDSLVRIGWQSTTTVLATHNNSRGTDCPRSAEN